MNAPDPEAIRKQISPLLAQRPEYDRRCIKRIVFTLCDKERAIGLNTAKLLHNLLHRSRDLFDGSVHALLGSQVLSTYLTVRAHMETTGCIQYLRIQLYKYYDKAIDLDAFNDIVYRQFLGGRIFPDRTRHPDAPDAVQILNCIDSVNKATELKRINREIDFREIYDMLSEYCHPNFLGHSVGVDTEESGNVVYASDQSFDSASFTDAFLGLASSCCVLFSAFDDAMSKLSENEVLPDVQK
ncbi:MAG: hypothetical protein NTY53_07200 [Kiritimatiellaeota bacterium]|nr:hypothetical protein [Kiritimatiellota bacterium]